MDTADFAILAAAVLMAALMLNDWIHRRRRARTARLQARILCAPAPPCEYDDFEDARWNRN